MKQFFLPYSVRTIVLLFVLSLLASCGKDRAEEYYELVGSKKWIYDTVLAEYLYKDDEITKSFTPKEFISLDPSKFFTQMLSKKDGKSVQGNFYYYSHLDSITPGGDTQAALAGLDEVTDYGFEYVLVSLGNNGLMLRVLYVEPGSPAEVAGLKRGDWIGKIDKQDLSTDLVKSKIRYPQTGCTLTRYKLSADGTSLLKDSEVTVGAPVAYVPSSLLLDSVYQVGQKKVAYILFNHFNIDDLGHTVERMNRLVEAQPDEVILDLRYNGGGYLSLAQMMATYLIQPANINKVFLTSKPNGDIFHFEKRKYSTDSPKQSYSLTDTYMHYNHLFILTSSGTASASETMINGLRPYLHTQLQQVGETTFGKNVMQRLYTNDLYPNLQMWLTTDYVSNSEGFYEYADGLTPAYKVSEDIGGIMPELPSEEDPLLKSVYEFIRTGAYPKESVASRTNSLHRQATVVYKSLDRFHKMAIK